MKSQRIWTALLSVFCFAALSSAALAQGSGTTRPTSNYPSSPNNYKVTRVVKGTIQHIDQEKHVLTIVDEKSGKSWAVFCTKKTKYRAEKGLFESKKITEDQLKLGLRVRVNFEEANLQAREVKVLKPRKS